MGFEDRVDKVNKRDSTALILGRGTSSNPLTISTANSKFLEFRCTCAATSGDNRLQYQWYTLSGGGGGESLRSMTYVASNVGTAHGAHLSLSFLATAGGSECSGLGVAVRGTLHIPNIASWAPTGTYAAGMFEIYSDGANSNPTGMTELSLLTLGLTGNGTGADTGGTADVDDMAYLLTLTGGTIANGNVVEAAVTEANYAYAARCKINGTVMYLMFSSDAA